MDSLPVNATFPQSMHDLGYASIISPQTDVKFTGSSNADVDTIVTEDLTLTGHSNMTVHANVITFGDTNLTQTSSLTVTPAPASWGIPSALRFSTRYVVLPSTYDEIKP